MLSYQSINIQTSNLIHNIFTDSCLVITNDNHMHSPTSLAKLPIFDGLSFEGSKICQDDEALHILLMVMSIPSLEENYG